MKKFALALLSVFASILLFSSLVLAQKDFYTPNALVTPMHTQAKQLYTLIGYGRGVEVNASYSPLPHLALFATGSLNIGTRSRTSILGDRYFINKADYSYTGGVEWFGKVGAFTIEALGGAGYFWVDNYWAFESSENSKDYLKGSYTSAFMQANVSKQVRNFNFGFATRFSWSFYDHMYFTSLDGSGSIIESGEYQQFDFISMEPAFWGSYNLNGLLLGAQLGFSIPVTYPESNRVSYHVYENISSKEKFGEMFMVGRFSISYLFNL